MWKLTRYIEKALEFIQGQISLRYHLWTNPGIISIKGIKLPIIPDLPRGLKNTLYKKFYEKYELKMIKGKLEPEDIVMELGTGLGLISSYCARKIGDERVFTYEANPALEEIIYTTYKLNDVHPCLQIVLLSDRAGEQSFYVNKSFWASSTIRRSPEDKEIKVPVASFNEEIRKINPSFLILDIEGGEYELFKSADFHNVKKIAMELHENLLGEEKTNFIKSRLTSAGFVLNERFCYRNRELFWERC